MNNQIDNRPSTTGHHHEGEFSMACGACEEEWVAERTSELVHFHKAATREVAHMKATAEWEALRA